MKDRSRGKESSRGRVTRSHLNRAFCVVLARVTFLYIYISILKRNLKKISLLRDVGNYNSMEQKSWDNLRHQMLGVSFEHPLGKSTISLPVTH